MKFTMKKEGTQQGDDRGRGGGATKGTTKNTTLPKYDLKLTLHFVNRFKELILSGRKLQYVVEITFFYRLENIPYEERRDYKEKILNDAHYPSLDDGIFDRALSSKFSELDDLNMTYFTLEYPPSEWVEPQELGQTKSQKSEQTNVHVLSAFCVVKVYDGALNWDTENAIKKIDEALGEVAIELKNRISQRLSTLFKQEQEEEQRRRTVTVDVVVGEGELYVSSEEDVLLSTYVDDWRLYDAIRDAVKEAKDLLNNQNSAVLSTPKQIDKLITLVTLIDPSFAVKLRKFFPPSSKRKLTVVIDENS